LNLPYCELYDKGYTSIGNSQNTSKNFFLLKTDGISYLPSFMLEDERNERNSRAKLDKKFPHFSSGKIVKGFGRGSKDLGIPTANFSQEVVDKLPENFDQGVYYGYAKVDNQPISNMVMSIGTNPHYNNIKKTMVLKIPYF
jgi:hypothetical protein